MYRNRGRRGDLPSTGDYPVALRLRSPSQADALTVAQDDMLLFLLNFVPKALHGLLVFAPFLLHLYVQFQKHLAP